MIQGFEWAASAEFVGRRRELAELERWWADSSREPVALYGRRRVGKSWLLRRFSDGKQAVVLVGREASPRSQFGRFATELEPLLGVRPMIDDLADLIRVLFQAARHERLLVVIDEFPYLLPSTSAAARRELTSVAAVMEEERERSQLKLVVCGSLVGQMESLLAERAPLRGRLHAMQLHPMPFAEASLFMPTMEPQERFERFAIAGGMPRYLASLSSTERLVDVVAERVFSPNAALWDEPRAVLEQELREPRTYFAILEQLAAGDKDTGELARGLREDTKFASKYVSVLEHMRIIERRKPVGGDDARNGRWHLIDPFFRFWFRFVFPFQDDLGAGLPGVRLFTSEVEPVLNDHVASAFEEQCRQWVREHQDVTRVGLWWGRSLDAHRASGERTTEEINVVGMRRGRVALVGEARWRNRPMSARYLAEVEQYKLPALRQSGIKVDPRPLIMLFSRAGFDARLQALAVERDDVLLVEASTVLSPIVEGPGA